MTNEILQSLKEMDTTIFLFFNGMHASFWDGFMYLFTGKLIWVPMYTAILYVLLKNVHWKVALCCIVAITLTITFADQMCNSIIRPAVERLRPSGNGSPIAELCHIVNGKRGGGYGFPSCHAANSFGLAVFLMLLFRKRQLTVFIISWAVINSYSRLYLGLHYPGDLLAGAIIGGFGGWLMYYLLTKVPIYKKTDAKQTEVIIYVGLLVTLSIIIASVIKCV